MALNLHLVRQFARVADLGSFSRAAELLHISQPAVSRAVRELEAQIGAPLLERGPGGLVLTEAGRILHRHAESLFGAERAAEEELAALRGLSHGPLAIGASTTIATWFLPRVLARFAAQYPRIALSLHTGNSASITRRLLARDLDIALVEGPPAPDPALRATLWRTDRMVALTAPGHRLAAETAPELVFRDELLLIREPGSGTREVVLRALASRGITPARTMEVESTEMIVQLAAAGFGVAIVSEAAAAGQLALGRLVRLALDDVAVSRPLSRLAIAGRQPSPAAMAFNRLLDKADTP